MLTPAAPLNRPRSVDELLTQVFGLKSLRPGQGEAIDALCRGQDALVLLPTGGGKSLCYQLAALWWRNCGGGPTVVISPLIALMQDQVRALVARGIRGLTLHTQQNPRQQAEVIKTIIAGRYDVLYVAPERALSPGFLRLLQAHPPAVWAIDEAHCISQWGHDFRPEYGRLSHLRKAFGNIPTVALTATATPRVLRDIEVHLVLQQPVRVLGSFIRENLALSAHRITTDAARMQQLQAQLGAHGFTSAKPCGRAIIYCATRKKVETVACNLRAAGIAAADYHAGRSTQSRQRVQAAYDAGETPILVATNAFGMGVDQPDVRLVVHFQAPASLEAYYQEAGRAGRDGQSAACHLFYSGVDWQVQAQLARRSLPHKAGAPPRHMALARLRDYAEATQGCRQARLVAYFTDEQSTLRCERCDICLQQIPVVKCRQRPASNVQPLPAAAQAHLIAAVTALRRPVGRVHLAKALRGSQAKSIKRLGLLQLADHGSLRAFAEDRLVAAIQELIEAGVFAPMGQKYPTVWLAGRPVRGAQLGKPTQARRRAPNPLAQALRRYSRQQARKLGWRAAYMVLPRQLCAQIVCRRPTTLTALQALRGMGPLKLMRFGADILQIVTQHT